jgi:ribosomal protein S18 acetylase RimI-like enzyme
VLLAEVDGIAVATISAFKPKRLKNVPSVKARNLYQISDIFVDHAYRRNGIGEALYAEARRRVIEQGGEGLSFNVWAFNADARRFYDRIGAKCVSHHYEDYD